MITMAGAGATTVTYKHNAFGERVSRVEGSTTTHFHYDQDGRLLAESDGTGTLIREYLWLGDKPLGVVVGPVASATLYFVHGDHLERVQKITDAGQAIVWDGQFTPYGRTHAITGAVQNPLRFPGQWADPAANYFYNYMRDYDPTLARYLSSDPLGTRGGRNKYGYASANPQNLVDPSGQIAPLAILAIGGGAAIGAYGGSYLGQRLAHWLSGDCGPFVFDQAQAFRAAQWGALFGLGGGALLAGRLGAAGLAGLAGPGAGLAPGFGPSLGAGLAGAGGASSGLLMRASQVHGALDRIAQSQRTTAVLQTSTGRIIASGSRDLTPGQLRILSAAETGAMVPGAHAEITALTVARALSQSPQAMAVTRAICPQCANFIQSTGGILTSPRTVIWPSR